MIPFDNLSSDRDLDWMRRAVALVVVNDLGGVPAVLRAGGGFGQRRVRDPGFARVARLLLSTQRAAGNSRRCWRIVGEGEDHRESGSERAGGAGRSSADERTGEESEPGSSRVRYGERRCLPDVWGGAGEGPIGRRPCAVWRLLRKADPNFSQAYLDWAEVAAVYGRSRRGAQGDRSGPARAAGRDLAARSSNYTGASIRGDVQGTKKRAGVSNALDAGGLENIPGTGASCKFPAGNFERRSEISKRRDGSILRKRRTGTSWVMREAYAGDLEGAKQALEHYQQLLPTAEREWPGFAGGSELLSWGL